MTQASPLHELTSAAGAVLAESAGWEMPARYGDVAAEYAAARNAAAVFDLSHLGKVEVTGADAPSFLHNLCTNEILGMPLGAGCEAFFCTSRAKVVAHALIYHVCIAGQNAFWLDVAPGEAGKLVAHLDHFRIAEQVELKDVTADFAQLHLAGPAATGVLSRALADTVPELDRLMHMERTFGVNLHAHIRRNDTLRVPGYDIVCLNAVAPGLWRILTGAGAIPAGLDAFEVLRVEAGTPVYGIDIDENRFAFDVGRTAQAISYAKGCYLGQEPIVMARDRAGHAPRTLTGLKLAGADAAPRGAKIFRGNEEVGWVTSSVSSPRLGCGIALAYLRFGHFERGTNVEIETVGGRGRAEVAPLPF
jgi:folate-binding protein YgfZ